jgi:hypothetical protein
VAYWTGTSAQSGSNDLFWDATNSRLGIGTNVPSTALHINSDITSSTNGLTITRTGVALADANFQVGNLTSLANQFCPAYFFTSNYLFSSATIGGFIGARITNNSPSDIGLILEARTKSGSALSSGYILSFRSLTTDYVRIAHNGNMLLQNGGTFTDSGQRLQVQGTTLLNGNVTFSSATGMFWDATNSRLGIGTNAPDRRLDVTGNTRLNGQLLIGNTSSGFSINSGYINAYSDAFIGIDAGRTFSITNAAFTATYFQIVRNTGNVLINSTSDSGERLQVTGTTKLAGDTTVSGGNFLTAYNWNGATYAIVRNQTQGANAQAYAGFISDSSAGSCTLGKYGTATTAYKIQQPKDCYLYNGTVGGDISILNDFATGNIKFAAGGASTAHMTIKSNGRINMSSLPTSPTGLSSGDLWNDAGTIKIV